MFYAVSGKIPHTLLWVYLLHAVIILIGPIFYHLPPIKWKRYQLMEEYVTKAMSSLIVWYRDMTK